MNLELEGIGYQARIGSQAPSNRLERRPHSGAGQSGTAWPSFSGLIGGYIRCLRALRGTAAPKPRSAKAAPASDSAKLLLDIGFSHSASYSIPEKDVIIMPAGASADAAPGSSGNWPPTRSISIRGISYARTHEVAAQICLFREREPYKGKGI